MQSAYTKAATSKAAATTRIIYRITIHALQNRQRTPPESHKFFVIPGSLSTRAIYELNEFARTYVRVHGNGHLPLDFRANIDKILRRPFQISELKHALKNSSYCMPRKDRISLQILMVPRQQKIAETA